MLYMTVYNWEADKTDEVARRKLARGAYEQPGSRLVAEWINLPEHRGFKLVETDYTNAVMADVVDWSDLTKVEVHPVLNSQDALKMAFGLS